MPTRRGANVDSGSVRTVTYNLDKAGNRTSVVDTGVTTGYSPNNLNQYITSVGADSITNGAEHEINSYKNVGYGYLNDEHLNLITYSTRNYTLAYDALGRCVKRTVSNGQTSVSS
jgi:YD repeat-containing protein